MPRTDKSVTVMTGMIIAALYVVMLVGFVRESYMRRDAAMRAEASGDRPALYDVSKRVCRMAQPTCKALLADAGEANNCSVQDNAPSRLASEPVVPRTPEALRRALRAGP